MTATFLQKMWQAVLQCYPHCKGFSFSAALAPEVAHMESKRRGAPPLALRPGLSLLALSARGFVIQRQLARSGGVGSRLLGLVLACYGGFWGTRTELTKSTKHPTATGVPESPKPIGRGSSHP